MARQREVEEMARAAALAAEEESLRALRMQLEVQRRVDAEKAMLQQQRELEEERQRLLESERQRQQAQEDAAKEAHRAAQEKADRVAEEVRKRVDTEKKRLHDEFELKAQADAEAKRRQQLDQQAMLAEQGVYITWISILSAVHIISTVISNLIRSSFLSLHSGCTSLFRRTNTCRAIAE